MKKLNLWLNVILIIAVVILFVFQFTSFSLKTEEAGQKEETSQLPEEIEGQLNVAYVNIDSLLSGYDMYLDKQEEFVEEQTSSQAELQSRSRELQQEFKSLQEKVNKGLITRAKARMIQQNLGQKEQQLYQLRSSMSSELAEKEQIIYRQVLDNVMNYLDEYAKENGYHYILSFSFGGPILYTDERLEVTQEVLKGLNAKYDQENEEKK